MGYATEIINISQFPPPPPYTPQEPSNSSSYHHPIRHDTNTSDYNLPVNTFNDASHNNNVIPNMTLHRIPTLPDTSLSIANNITIISPSAPPDDIKQDIQNTLASLLQEACKNKHGCRFMMKQSKKPLVLYETWSGRVIQLNNRHENTIIHGSLIAHDSIQLENNKGNITVDNNIFSGKDIQIKISQGTLIVHGQCLVSKNSIKIETSHSPLQIENLIEAKRLSVKIKNAPLVMNHISLISQLSIRASKSSIEIYIVDIKSSSAKIKIETSHAFVNVYLSRQFSGEFDVESKQDVASVIDRSGAGSLLFKKMTQSHVSGTFIHGKKSKHSIFIKTSNAPATIHII